MIFLTKRLSFCFLSLLMVMVTRLVCANHEEAAATNVVQAPFRPGHDSAISIIDINDHHHDQRLQDSPPLQRKKRISSAVTVNNKRRRRHLSSKGTKTPSSKGGSRGKKSKMDALLRGQFEQVFQAIASSTSINDSKDSKKLQKKLKKVAKEWNKNPTSSKTAKAIEKFLDELNDLLNDNEIQQADFDLILAASNEAIGLTTSTSTSTSTTTTSTSATTSTSTTTTTATASLLFNEDFESFSTTNTNCQFGNVPPTYANGWVDGGGTSSWAVDTGFTPSTGTGPDGGNNGSANYIYAESSGACSPGATFIINSPPFNNAAAYKVSFFVSRFGDDIGTLTVNLLDGTDTVVATLGTLAGPDPCTCPDYTQVTFPISDSLPSTYRIQFFYTSGSDFEGDIAIDDVQVLA